MGGAARVLRCWLLWSGFILDDWRQRLAVRPQEWLAHVQVSPLQQPVVVDELNQENGKLLQMRGQSRIRRDVPQAELFGGDSGFLGRKHGRLGREEVVFSSFDQEGNRVRKAIVAKFNLIRTIG